ncbi:MAG: hypothetical protein KDB27_22055 [Planctomycetales bacterium]|nr:hypothetical protein [Planctomycetales bacterium]
MAQTPPRKTRLAPSPTGALHLGNARTFLINWALARQNDWRIVLRIDDLDGPRIKKGADKQAIDILSWLGLDWDEGPYYQSKSVERYETYLQRLLSNNLIYPCECTRTEIQAASQSAPHEGSHEIRYPGTCRPMTPVSFTSPIVSSGVGWRLKTDDKTISFNDRFSGPHAFNPHQEVGDFLMVTKQQTPSYQFSVVIDDHDQEITDVVRGDDLLNSTARQKLVYEAANIDTLPNYCHLPIVVGSDGKRLAKRHGDSRIVSYREQRVRPERIIGLIAFWSGRSERAEMSADEFRSWFEIQQLPRQKIIFTDDDHSWLG